MTSTSDSESTPSSDQPQEDPHRIIARGFLRVIGVTITATVGYWLVLSLFTRVSQIVSSNWLAILIMGTSLVASLAAMTGVSFSFLFAGCGEKPRWGKATISALLLGLAAIVQVSITVGLFVWIREGGSFASVWREFRQEFRSDLLAYLGVPAAGLAFGFSVFALSLMLTTFTRRFLTQSATAQPGMTAIRRLIVGGAILVVPMALTHFVVVIAGPYYANRMISLSTNANILLPWIYLLALLTLVLIYPLVMMSFSTINNRPRFWLETAWLFLVWTAMVIAGVATIEETARLPIPMSLILATSMSALVVLPLRSAVTKLRKQAWRLRRCKQLPQPKIPEAVVDPFQ